MVAKRTDSIFFNLAKQDCDEPQPQNSALSADSDYIPRVSHCLQALTTELGLTTVLRR